MHLVAGIEEPWRLERGTVHWEGGPGGPVRRDYLLVEVREHWPLLAEAEISLVPLRTASAAPAHDAPLILGPSATLQLLDHVLSSGGASVDRLHPMLEISEVAQCPYPPRALPPWLLGASRHAPAHPLPRLPDDQGAPSGALSCCDVLRVECTRPASPSAGVVVESLAPLTWRCDEGLWEARLALVEEDGAYALVPGRQLLRIDPHALLGRLVGGVHAARPALLRDPVQADRYGIAPALATTLLLGECLEAR